MNYDVNQEGCLIRFVNDSSVVPALQIISEILVIASS